MVQDRNLGVTEARVGLTIITCLLVVLGYVVLQRVAGTGQSPPIEIRSDQSAEQLESTVRRTPGDVELPYVLTPEGWDPTELPIHTTQRPQWLTPHDDSQADTPPGFMDPLGASPPHFSGSPPDESGAWRESRAPDPVPAR